MPEFFSNRLVHAALWMAAILILCALGILVVRKWRGSAADDQPDPSELLTKFRELHGRGSLSDEEYRTIKTKLATQISSTVNDTKDST